MIIDHLPYQEFKKFLKFSKAKEDGTFKVVPRAGIQIYDKENNEKIADVYTSGKKEVDIVLTIETGFGTTRKLLKSQKLELAKNIYFNLKKEYKST